MPGEHDDDALARDLFVGGVGPLWLLDYQLQGLFTVVELPQAQALAQPHLYGDVLRRACEVALVGSLGFFEAFCKHQFAALLSIHPPLLEGFATRRPEASIKLSVLAGLPDSIEKHIGFVIAEQQNFGSAKRVNGLFRDLLDVSPFTKAEGDRLDGILRRRHLIVHHGGIHTLESVRTSTAVTHPQKPFEDAVFLEPDEFYDITELLRELAVKLVVATVEGLNRRTNNLADLGAMKRDAVPLLLRAVRDNVE